MRYILLFGFVMLIMTGLLLPSKIFTAEGDYVNGEDKALETAINEAMKHADQFIQATAVERPSQAADYAPSAPAVSQIAQAGPLEKKRLPPTDLDFNQANLEDVITVIADVMDRNIVLDPSLKGKKVDLHLKKVDVEEALQLLYRAYGLGSYMIGNILFVSSEDKIKKGTAITKMVEVKNISIKDAKEVINNLVTAINQSEETNSLILIGTSEDIAKAEEILKKIDLPQPAVMLEAKIIEINSDAIKELGIDWSDSTTVSFQETRRKTTLDSPAATSFASPLRIYRLARDSMQFDAVIHALEQKDKARILSNPKITTINNKEAEIFIGDRIPYTVNTIAGGVTTTQVQFVEPGIRLKITPSIVEKDFVVIKIEPEVSYIYAFKGANSEYPWVKTREATAYVRVKNQQPFVLGGLLSKEDKKNIFKVPILSNVPIFGGLFKYEKNTWYNTELIITVTPVVIAGD